MNIFTKLLSLVALVVIPCTVYSQEYSISTLDIPSNKNQFAVKISENGRYVLFDEESEGGESSCSTLYDRNSKKLTHLCDEGISQANAVNNNGEVVGYREQGEDRQVAVLWEASHGITELGFLSSSDTVSQAGSINNNGVVVGASSYPTVISYTIDDDGDGIPDDTDEDGTPDLYMQTIWTSRAFVWTKKRGLKEAFPTLHQYSTVALKVNDRGRILLGRSKEAIPQTFDKDFYSFRYGAFVRESSRKFRQIRKTYLNIYNYDLSEGISYTTMNARGDVLSNGILYRVGKPGKNIAERYAGRGDLGSSSHLSNSGKAALKDDAAAIYTDRRGEVALSCLIPQNREVVGANGGIARTLTVSHIGGFTSSNALLVSGNIDGDGKSERLFLIEPLPESQFGKIYDFCPDLSLDTAGTCSKGGECSPKVSVFSNGQPYVGVKLELFASDIDIEASCKNVDLGTFVTGQNGKKTVSFVPDSRFRYFIRFSGVDADRFNFDYVPEIYFSSDYKSDHQCSPYGGR